MTSEVDASLPEGNPDVLHLDPLAQKLFALALLGIGPVTLHACRFVTLAQAETIATSETRVQEHRLQTVVSMIRARQPKEPKGRLRDLWVRVGGLRIYARASQRPAVSRLPVVLVHGYGMSSRYMVPIAKRLAAEHTVYAPDLPGHGQSDDPERTLSMPELADCLRAWMDAVGIDQAAFLGNSMGCQILAELAVHHPERVDRLILVSPTVDPAARSFRRQLPRFLRTVIAERISIIPMVGIAYLRTGFRRLRQEMHIAFEDRIEQKLSRISVPSLVIRGERDAIVPHAWAAKVAEKLRAGDVRVIRGKGHALNYNAADELMRVIRPFLDPDNDLR